MNKSVIIEMLEYCGMSYLKIPKMDKNEKIVFVDDENTDVQYCLKIRKESITIIFRGSDSFKDWVINLKFWKSSILYDNYSSFIKVHFGFLSIYKSKNVRERIHNFITDNIKKIYITGHSYGAALAILCALDLKNNFPERDYEVIVFGCPRIGNKYFRDLYNLKVFKTIRVENRGDLITKIPFAILGYKHVGSKVVIGQRHIFRFFSLKKHNLQEYYSNVWHF